MTPSSRGSHGDTTGSPEADPSRDPAVKPRDDRFILLGKILSPHGVRGQVKLASYAEQPENLTAYGPLFDRAGKRQFRITLEGQTSNTLIARIEGVSNRDEAEKLRNIELFVPRSLLPALKEGEYYQSDLLGLPVFTENGERFGTLAAFHNFGAGLLAEIQFENKESEFYRFDSTIFPLVDPKTKKLVIVPPQMER